MNVRRLWPGSLPSWVLIILVLALAMAQITALVVISSEVAKASRSADLFRLAERTMVLAREIHDTRPADRSGFLSNINGPTIAASFGTAPIVNSVVARYDDLAEMEDLLMAKLMASGITDLRIDQRAPHPPAPPAAGAGGQKEGAAIKGELEELLSGISTDYSATGQFLVSMQIADGGWFNAVVPMSPVPGLLSRTSLLLYLGVFLLIVATSVWAVSQLTAPYRKLEAAARKISEDLRSPPLAEAGSKEVRTAIRALNAMQARLREYVSDREHLAAALAHDLRTPLTRMKIRSELLRSAKERQLFQSDIEQLQGIISSVIDFANLSGPGAARSPTDIVSMAESVCDGLPKSVFRSGPADPERVVANVQPVAMERCLRNLVENALRYAGNAEVSVHLRGSHIEIWVEDNGPGIPEDELSNVLKPFHRLERSRNPDSGGTGLGLAIADAIMRANGGELRLLNRPEGGIRAVLSIPSA